jgi:hypothetical protein
MPKGVAMGFPGGSFTGTGAEQAYFGSSLAGASSEGGTVQASNESRSSDPRNEEMNSKRQPSSSPELRPPTPQMPAHQSKSIGAGEPQDIRIGRDDASVSSTAVNDDYLGRYGSHRC